jgi:hypothetical protein
MAVSVAANLAFEPVSAVVRAALAMLVWLGSIVLAPVSGLRSDVLHRVAHVSPERR